MLYYFVIFKFLGLVNVGSQLFSNILSDLLYAIVHRDILEQAFKQTGTRMIFHDCELGYCCLMIS